MPINRISKNIFFLITLLSITACSSVQETTTKKAEPEIKPLWTNAISLDAADEFVSQLDIKNVSGLKPVFLIGKIEASGVSDEIASGLEYDMELTLVNTGNVSFIEDKKTRDNERENRKSISDFETEDKFYTYYTNLKIDRFIEGKIIREETDNIVTSYIVALKVIDVQKKEISDWQKVVTR